MAKIYTAPFAQTPKTVSAVVTAAAVITSDAPTNTVLLLTAGSEGAVLTRLSAIPRATATDATLAVFISTDSGTTKRLIETILLPAQTVSTTSPPTVTRFPYTDVEPLRLQAGAQVYVATQVALASGVVFSAEYMDF